MNAGELRDRLDDWGDHLPVGIVLNYGTEKERWLEIVDVDDTTTPDGVRIELVLEGQ